MNMTAMALAVGALALMACNRAPDAPANAATSATPDSVTVNGFTYVRAGSTPGPAATANPPAPAAGTIPTIGRWVSIGRQGDNCEEIADISFTPTGITEHKPDGSSEDHPMTYSNVTPSGFTINEASSGRALANVAMNGAATLTMTKARSPETCTLKRR